MPSGYLGDLRRVTAALAQAGFVAAEEEAVELLACTAGDDERLEGLLARRLTGEPLAWVTGAAPFCGTWIGVDRGVYVPRRHSEVVALRAVELLPDDGLAVDVCTGSGAIAAILQLRRPGARVVATDADPRAVACARANGVDALGGDLLAPLPEDLLGRVDVLVGVVPYVPTPELSLLQRDTFAFEDRGPYDGGAGGLDVVRRVARDGRRLLRDGGSLVLEIGGDQDAALRDELPALGYAGVRVLRDEDGDVRGVETVAA